MKLFLALLLLFLPTLLYAAYLTMRRRSVGGADWWESGPGFWVALSGVVLLIGALATWALTSGAPPDSLYVPERYVDGELVEGHFESRDSQEPSLDAPDGQDAP